MIVQMFSGMRYQVSDVDVIQVLCVITMPVALIIESHEDATFTFVSVSILLCNFLSMALVFIPKVRAQV